MDKITNNRTYNITKDKGIITIKNSDGLLKFEIIYNGRHECVDFFKLTIMDTEILTFQEDAYSEEIMVWYIIDKKKGICDDYINYISEILKIYPDLTNILGKFKNSKDNLFTFEKMEELNKELN